MSSDNNMELSRRKILASMGAVGAAGAAAGLGTSALYGDTEKFVNNSITAGELDLKVDWEEHYSFPQIYPSFDDPAAGLDVTRTEPTDSRNYVALPDPQNPIVWANDDDDPTGNDGPTSFELYFQRTTIEAFPDAVGPPIQADFGDSVPCELLADVPPDLGTYNDDVDHAARTRNADTYDSQNSRALPLIHLTDVKPGDFGELTLSTHLCDNDGYLWMQMPGGVQNDGNDLEGPEENIANDSTDGPGEGELAENIQTALWYDDDCSNTINGRPEPLLAMALIDTSDSISNANMKQIAAASDGFVEAINDTADTDVAAGVMTFSGEDAGVGADDIVLQNDVEKVDTNSAYLDSSGEGLFYDDNNDEVGDLLPSSGSGGTPLAPALDLAREVLNDRAQTLINTSGNGFGPETRKSILVISDGLPTAPQPDRYNVVDDDGNPVIAQNAGGVTNESTGQFASDVFDGFGNDFSSSTPVRDEALLVARDIDDGPRADNTSSNYSADFDGDPISGSDNVTLRAVGVDTGPMGSDQNIFLNNVATRDGLFYRVADFPNLSDFVNDIVTDLNISGQSAEEVLFRGTLAELESLLAPSPDGNGPLPLDGNRMNSDYDEVGGDPTDGPAEGRDCFEAGMTHCFGLAWWLPASVGNEVQGDSVGFDLAFLTEQCRNNDDPGSTVL